ncbi:hypothetical protein HW132_23430 [Brasilonema sp. CT11]|nr:hypothetical protein [Brasilonema sp. CT11]
MQIQHLATTVETKVSQSEHLWLVDNVTVYTIDSYASKVSHSDRMDNCFSSLNVGTRCPTQAAFLEEEQMAGQ